MTEQEFALIADQELSALESALERLSEHSNVELDVETKPGGILELEFADASKLIINRHMAAREIWVAARSGGFHFSYRDGRWIAGRDGAELWSVVEACVVDQSGTSATLATRRT